MNPSIVLAAALAATGASFPAYAQPAPAPLACARKEGAPPALDGKAPDAPFDASSETLSDAVWRRATAAGVKLDPDKCRLLTPDGHMLTRREVEALQAEAAPIDPKSKERDVKKLDGARAALDGVGSAERDSKQRFDGAVPRGGGSLEVSGGAAGAAGSPQTRLSAALNSDLRKKYSEEEAGRGLLAHFTDADGVVRLPGVGLVDYGEAAAATYDPAEKIIHLNQREAAKAAVLSAPEAERAVLAKSFVDPARLSAYLVGHSEARASLLDQQAGTFFHETFHAWQHRRDPPIEAAEGKDPVEWEREAFREELRYFHQRVMRDPSLADRSPDTDMYKRLLGGYPEFKSYVTELYQNSFGSGSFATVDQILAKRAKAGRQGAASEREALREADADYKKREADFASNVLPAIQSEAYPLLIARRMAAGRPGEALALAYAAPEDVRRESGPKAYAATLAYLRGDPPPPLPSRLDAWQSYLAYQTRTAGSNEMPPDVYALYERDCRAEIAERLAEAAKARSRQARVEALDWATFYAGALPDKEQMLKRIKAARVQ